MRILILLLLLTGTVLQSEPKNIYAEEAYQDGEYYNERFNEYGNYIEDEEDESLAEKKSFTKEVEEAEIKVLITSMENDVLQKVINLGADEYKDRQKAIHDFTLYLLSIINPKEETDNYKYRYEQLKFILLIIVNSYKQTDDVELKFGLLEIMELTYKHLHYQDLKDYAKKSNAYGNDNSYVKQMLEIAFKVFIEGNEIKIVIDPPFVHEDDDN